MPQTKDTLLKPSCLSPLSGEIFLENLEQNLKILL